MRTFLEAQTKKRKHAIDQSLCMTFDDFHQSTGESFDCVSQEGERLDLCAHEVNKKFFVEVLKRPKLSTRLQSDCVEDCRQESHNRLMNILLVKLVHEDEDDRQLLKDFK